MRPKVVQNADDRWAKTSENSPGGVEGNPLGQVLRRLSGLSSRVHPRRGYQGGVRAAARVAVALGSAWMLLAFWAYPAHGWLRTIPGVGGSEDEAQALIRDAAGDVIVAGKISDNFAVTKFSGATGAELWRQEIDGTASQECQSWWCNADEARAVAVDGSNDVIAVGSLDNSSTTGDFTVIKFSGATGEELWRRVINGTNFRRGEDAAQAVAVDASGDVIAAGHLNNGPSYHASYDDFTVIKFSGATGEELWRWVNDRPGGHDRAQAVAVDASGDVIAAGSLLRFSVIKFSGATGEELWRQEITGTVGYYGSAQAVAVDGSGDVIAAGYLTNLLADWDFTVIKFSGATGDELWRQEIDGTAGDDDVAQAVAVDGSGDVIAAGYLTNLLADKDFTVIKFSDATGEELWRQEITGTVGYYGSAQAVAVDGSGDVIAAGYLTNLLADRTFTVSKFSGATGDELWRREIDGTDGDDDVAQAVAVDASGDVIAAGSLRAIGSGQDFAVIKFSGATGDELWRQEIDGTAGDHDVAQAVAVDGSGDVVVAGSLINNGTHHDFTVIKFSGATGAELWRQEIDGTDGDDDVAQAVAVDTAGDVIAAGCVSNSGGTCDFTVIKFSDATGAELWRQEIDGTAGEDDVLQAVAVDGSGDVIAVGSLKASGTADDFTVIKFSGATGGELWRKEIDGTGGDDVAQAVAVDASGDVIAVGSLHRSGEYNFTVIKFSGATGDELWRQDIDKGRHYAGRSAQAVAVDGSGDVIAAGYLTNLLADEDFTVIKFSGATGQELWRREIDGTYRVGLSDYGEDSAQAVAVDDSGDVIAAGYLENSDTGYDFTVMKFSGATGRDLWRQEIYVTGLRYRRADRAQALAVDASGDVIAAGFLYASGTADDFTVIKFFDEAHTGGSLLVKDNASDPDRRQLKVVSKDPNWPVPPQGSANDPTLAGASVRLLNPSSGEEATFDLPPGPQWRVTSTPSGVVKYLYRDRSGLNGPCIKLKAIVGKRLQALCTGSRGLIPFTLDEPSQGELVAFVQFGGAEPECVWFGGRVMKDRGTSNPGPAGIFKARKAAARLLDGCPAPPSPSAAFLDVAGGVLD